MPTTPRLTSVSYTHLTPGNAKNNLGRALLNQHRLSEALEQFRAAIEFQPDLCLAYNNAGVAYEELNQASEARRIYQSGVERPACKRYAEPRYHLANLLLADGEIDAAVAMFQSCASSQPSTPFADRCAEYLRQTQGQ